MRSLLLIIISLLFLTLTAHAQYPGAPDFGSVIYSFNAGIQTPTPDRVLFGVEYADGHLWVNGFDPDDFSIHKLYKFTVDGDLVETYAQGIGFKPWKGLAFDGTHLYTADKDSLTEISTLTGYPTGVQIPAPINPVEAVAYDPVTDRFWIYGYSSPNIYEIDRSGNVYRVYPRLPERNILGLAWDTWSPGGPFIWSFSTVIRYDENFMIADQLHVETGSWTGTYMLGVRQTPNPYTLEYAGGFTMTDQILNDTVVFVAMQQGHYQSNNDGLDWVVVYNGDLTDGVLPGPYISVDPDFLENTLEPGDSTEITISIANDGIADLNWSARIEGLMPPPGGNASREDIGEVLDSFNATALTPNLDNGLSNIEFAKGKYWITGRDWGSDFPKLYSISPDGSSLESVSYLPSLLSFGWSTMASDGNFLYGLDQYYILEYDMDSLQSTGNFINRPQGGTAMTYDPQSDHFWLGGGNGSIVEFDRQGNEINFFVTPYDIEGLAWDPLTPGGPYLWVWSEETAPTGALAVATRLDPETCQPTGVSFPGANTSGSGTFPDKPLAATITSDLIPGKMVFVALHDSDEGDDPGDKVVVYDLNVTPPPNWIELVGPTFGTISPGNTGNLTLRMQAIMDDTVMTAGIKISSNDIINNEVIIPVNLTMALLTNIDVPVKDDRIVIYQNQPNPFTDRTRIRFSIPEEQHITLRIYDMTGSLVARPLEREVSKGSYDVEIFRNDLKPGVYFYQLNGKDFSETRKMIVR